MGWWLRKLALVEDPGSVPTLGSSQLMPVPGISHTLFAFHESLYTSKARKLMWAHTHINLNVKGHRLKAELTVLASGVNTGLEFSSQCPNKDTSKRFMLFSPLRVPNPHATESSGRD